MSMKHLIAIVLLSFMLLGTSGLLYQSNSELQKQRKLTEGWKSFATSVQENNDRLRKAADYHMREFARGSMELNTY